MNDTPSHAGDLEFFYSLPPETTQYSVSANKPTMFGGDSFRDSTSLVVVQGDILLGPFGPDDENPKSTIICFDD